MKKPAVSKGKPIDWKEFFGLKGKKKKLYGPFAPLMNPVGFVVVVLFGVVACNSFNEDFHKVPDDNPCGIGGKDKGYQQLVPLFGECVTPAEKKRRVGY